MMNNRFKTNVIKLALCLAYPALNYPALAQDAWPAIPAALSPAVTPNIMLLVDTSGSMLQDDHNQFFDIPAGGGYDSATRCQFYYADQGYDVNIYGWDYTWGQCIPLDYTNWRTRIDVHPDTKMVIAKNVMINLIDNNRNLRFGLFSFQDQKLSLGGDERAQAGILRRPIGSVAAKADRDALVDAINGLYGRTATPLGEALLEVTRYYAGETSLYGLLPNAGDRYTSPMQYRCQRNFTIVITDGDATNDENLPGTGVKGTNTDANPVIPALSYVARDSSGAAVQKSFSVCSAASTQSDDTYNVTCPATYDSDGVTARVFKPGASGDTENRPGALRDVAMYANRADLHVGGTDLDGKSFDDPKFALQNMVTFTVGFAVDNAVLPSAAKVGGGKYYNANNEVELTAALNDAVASIGNVVSNASGGPAANGATLSTADKMFLPVFHPTGWYGELRCFKLDAQGNATGACAPNAGAVFPAPAERNIVTANVVAGVTNPFAFTADNVNKMTTEQKNALGPNTPEQKEVINFIRGEEGIDGFRTRPDGLLGDIVDGKPLTIGVPGGQTTDNAYADFTTAHHTRGMVFIGANDGMLHGFTTSNMTEIFGFVPSPVYPKLKTLTAINYGGPVTPHVYHVNGALRQQDLKLSGGWMTLLVGGLAQGGQGWFALNATNPTTLADPDTAVKWEFTDKSDPDLGYTFGIPVIYNVRTSTTDAVPVVLLPNGYKNNYDDGAVGANPAVLFIVDADDGKVVKKIATLSDQGLSSPAGVDFPADGVLDYVYAGDRSGKLWRFDLTSPINATLPDPHLVFDAGPGHPIIQRPVIQVVKDKDGKFLGNLVIFGTGSLLEGSDRLDNTTQTMYGVLDRMGNGTVDRNDLAERRVEEAVVASGDQVAGTYRRIYAVDTSTPFDLSNPNNAKRGWFLDLPALSERLAATPYLLSDRVLFGTGIPNSAEVCNTGSGWLMAVNPLTGLVIQGPRGGDFDFYDVKMDGRSTDADKVQFPTGKSFVSGVKLDGIPTELLVVVQSMEYATFASDNPFALAAANMALQDSNASGVFDGTSVGKGQGAHTQQCLIGSDDCVKFTAPKAGGGVRVETTIWREIR
ncbi:MAG: hypothetical protein LBE62_06590 [Azonexus sp.]|jgi:type IV pilus assembly protein PilY1|nr:hypothetical protein [Azonexus sp.]